MKNLWCMLNFAFLLKRMWPRSAILYVDSVLHFGRFLCSEAIQHRPPATKIWTGAGRQPQLMNVLGPTKPVSSIRATEGNPEGKQPISVSRYHQMANALGPEGNAGCQCRLRRMKLRLHASEILGKLARVRADFERWRNPAQYW